MKLYVAGPMTGLPDYNYPAFHAAEAKLRAAGYDVANPASLGVRDGWEWQDYMRAGLRLMLDCDGIALLDGWHASRGAQIELRLAMALGMAEGTVPGWLMLRLAMALGMAEGTVPGWLMRADSGAVA